MQHEPVLIELSLVNWQGLDRLSPIDSAPRMRVQIENFSSKDHDGTTHSCPLASRMERGDYHFSRPQWDQENHRISSFLGPLSDLGKFIIGGDPGRVVNCRPSADQGLFSLILVLRCRARTQSSFSNAELYQQFWIM